MPQSDPAFKGKIRGVLMNDDFLAIFYDMSFRIPDRYIYIHISRYSVWFDGLWLELSFFLKAALIKGEKI